MISKFNQPPLSYTPLRERFRSSENSRSTVHESANKNVSQNANKCVNLKNANMRLREPGEVSFCGLSAEAAINKVASNPKNQKLFKNSKFQKLLDFANDQSLVFGAGFALLLTCILRPGAIVVIPSKKNKDDQKYAAAHSIASGVIGFGISTVLFMPIGNAIKKFKENPDKYINKSNSYLKTSKHKATAIQYMDRFPDIITAIPKGILTVALIPPILKYVFGLEKKKPASAKVESKANVDYSLLNFKNKNESKSKELQNSTGGVK